MILVNKEIRMIEYCWYDIRTILRNNIAYYDAGWMIMRRIQGAATADVVRQAIKDNYRLE